MKECLSPGSSPSYGFIFLYGIYQCLILRYYNIYLVCLFIVCLPFPLKALSVRAGALPWAPLSSRAPMPLSYFKIRERIETWCVAGRAKLLRANQEYRKGVQSRTHWWRGQHYEKQKPHSRRDHHKPTCDLSPSPTKALLFIRPEDQEYVLVVKSA